MFGSEVERVLSGGCSETEKISNFTRLLPAECGIITASELIVLEAGGQSLHCDSVISSRLGQVCAQTGDEKGVSLQPLAMDVWGLL